LQSKGEELIYNQVEILNKDELVYNELIVPRGGNYKLMLSDGTEVYLNSDTKIKYPESFHKDAPRVVELVYGEAYFKVVSMDNKASSSSEFQVKTANQTIHVLGTEFNVANYSEKNQIETTLINGKVSLHSTFEKLEEVILVIEKNVTQKRWYHDQQVLLENFNIPIKIILL